MNALKQKWKDFIVWFVKTKGLSNKRIEKCKMKFVSYFPTNIRHDCDNYVPKFILDGLVEGGLVVDDDYKHIQSLTLEGDIDKSRPRTEITIYIYE